MSEPKFEVGQTVKLLHPGGSEAVILAGPVERQYWTRNKHTGAITTYYENSMHPVPRVTLSEAQIELVHRTITQFQPSYPTTIDRIIDVLRRDHLKEEPKCS